MHVLIIGEIGAGKSTLIQSLLEGLPEPAGFLTKKEPADETGSAGVYLHRPAGPRCFCKENLAGACGAASAVAFPDVFDTLGVRLLEEPSNGRVVLMDELGFLESKAAKFCAKALELMDGEDTVLAAVKTRDTEFLRAVRSHPKALCYTVDAHSRDCLAERILQDLERLDPASPLLAARSRGTCPPARAGE